MRARDNPFSVERIESVRYRSLTTTFGALLARLDALGHQAAIVGPQGSGKTTLLEDIHHALDLQGVTTRSVFANDTAPLDRSRRQRLLSELGRDDVVLLDGADTLSRSGWMRFQRHVLDRAAGLVITTHRPGALPTLIECHTTPMLLDEIVLGLLPSGGVSPDLLNQLYDNHKGNIRHCLRALYDLYASGDLKVSV